MRTSAIIASILLCAPALRGAGLPATVTSRGGLAFGGAEIDIVAYAPGWKLLPVKAEWISVPEIGRGAFTIAGENGITLFRGKSVWEQSDNDEISGHVEVSCVAPADMRCLAVVANVPAEPPCGLGDGTANAFDLPLSDNRTARLSFTNGVPYHAQDSRQWGGKWTVRFGETAVAPRSCTPGEKFLWDITLSAPEGFALALAKPIEIAEGPDWARLDFKNDVVPGSALDFSNQGLQDAPAGNHGWLKAVGGHFEFEELPGKEQRFYGVNLCFTANYPDHDLADRIVDRLVRSGYNALRIHHHDGIWAKEQTDLLTPNGVRVTGHVSRVSGEQIRLSTQENSAASVAQRDGDIDRLDYLLAKCFERGIYATTDLYVSRKAPWRDIGIDRDGTLNQNLYKTYVGVHDGAFADWCKWSRAFLEHVNPYTGRAYKDEPGLPLISLINEGILAMGWDSTGKATDPFILAAWLEFREEANRSTGHSTAVDRQPESRNAGMSQRLSVVECRPSTTGGNAVLPEVVPSQGTPSFDAFDAWLTRRIFERCSGFIRSIGCRALLTNDNNGRFHGEGEGCTPLYDYIDSHFYVDHPTFIDQPWSLPAKCGNDNLIKASKPAIFHRGWAKGASKPYTISEWNIAYPGYYRGMGGILTGAMAAEQEWDGLWRFAYSHDRNNILDGGHGGSQYFDCVLDPLISASDRASVCLYLRGDAAQTQSDERRVTSDEMWKMDGHALRLDKKRGSMALVTPRTCGGFAEDGRIEAGPLSFEIAGYDGRPAPQDNSATKHSSLVTRHSSLGGAPCATTLWASSLDGEPLSRSSRILLVHLTDVQGEGAQFADERRRILLKWGETPLVRAGAADIELRLDDSASNHSSPVTRHPSLDGEAAARGFTIYALNTAGNRVGEIPAILDDGVLRFRVSTAGPQGGRIFYEIVR